MLQIATSLQNVPFQMSYGMFRIAIPAQKRSKLPCGGGFKVPLLASGAERGVAETHPGPSNPLGWKKVPDNLKNDLAFYTARHSAKPPPTKRG